MQAEPDCPREDAFGFYAVASASLLESAVPEYVTILLSLFQGDAEAAAWLSEQWIAEELEHGRLARAYVEEVWPEFSWQSAFAEYRGRIPKGTTAHLRSSQALEALARCVTETYAAMMYRCIASYTEDERLSGLLSGFSRDEVRHYTRFRRIFASHDESERNSLWRKGRTILGRSDLASGRDLAIAFSCLDESWETPPPFVHLSYDEFLRCAGLVIEEHFPFEPAVRMLLRPLGAGSPAIRTARWVLEKRIRAGIGVRGARRLTRPSS